MMSKITSKIMSKGCLILFLLFSATVYSQNKTVINIGEGTASGGVDSITYVFDVLASNVTLTTNNTFYDGPSVTLSSGNWLVIGEGMVDAGNSYSYLRLTDKTIHYGFSQLDDVNETYEHHIIHSIVSVGSQTDIYVQALAGINSRTLLAEFSAGPYVDHPLTKITAIKLSD